MSHFLLLESTGKTWRVRGNQLFTGEREAWSWVRSKYSFERDRERFYVVPIRLPAPPRRARTPRVRGNA